MSTVKKTSAVADKSSKVKATISRAEAIQQREQLRQMVLNKFINDLAKNNKKKQSVIEQEVNNFFKSEKITEQSLKELKNRVHAAVEGKVAYLQRLFCSTLVSSRPPLKEYYTTLI